MALDCLDNRLPQHPDFRFYPLEQMTLGLSPAANGLVKRLIGGKVNCAKPIGQGIERRQFGGQVVDADKAWITLQPLPSPVAKQPPRDRQIGPGPAERLSGNALLSSRGQLFQASGAKQEAETMLGKCRILNVS